MDGKGKKWGTSEAVGQGLRGKIRARVKPAGEGSELCRVEEAPDTLHRLGYDGPG